jgi:hypothetical protein
MGEVWRCLIAEITALGWRCFALGPEFWAGIAFAALLALAAVVIIAIWRD